MSSKGRVSGVVAALAAVAMTVVLVACGGSGAGGDGKPNGAPAAQYPSGLFMLEYLGDESGAYVADFNEYEDFLNRPITLLAMMWSMGDTIWCEVGVDGKGTFHAPDIDPVAMDFTAGGPDELAFGDSLVCYHVDRATGTFWFEEQPGFWDRMKPCSQAALDLVFEGKGGSVPLAEAQVGDVVCLGTYETVPGNDKTEPIFWLVIDKDESGLFLLSEKLLDSFSFNHNPGKADLGAVTWEKCSLRAFLNSPDGFLSCFTADELALIRTTHLSNKAANDELLKYWGAFHDEGPATYSDLAHQTAPDGPDTDDMVFLLSFQEVERYFGEATAPYSAGDDDYPFCDMPESPAWIAYVTPAVEDNGQGYFDRRTGGGAWLTRTLSTAHASNGMMATYITGGGQVFNYLTYVPLFIRPAMWVRV